MERLALYGFPFDVIPEQESKIPVHDLERSAVLGGDDEVEPLLTLRGAPRGGHELNSSKSPIRRGLESYCPVARTTPRPARIVLVLPDEFISTPTTRPPSKIKRVTSVSLCIDI